MTLAASFRFSGQAHVATPRFVIAEVDRLPDDTEAGRLRQRIEDDLRACTDMADIARGVETVGLVLGPYRNLSTLTAAALVLHPKVQALNHASARVLDVPEVDFIADRSRETMERFVPYALQLTYGGARGSWGGSVLRSHAFNEEALQETYLERFGRRFLKEDVRALVWKEPLRVQQHIMRQGADAGIQLLDGFPELQVVLPIRNPIDCAISHTVTPHHRHVFGERFGPALEGVLKSLAWVLELRDAFPDRVFTFTQWEFGRDTLQAMAAHLGLSASPEWIDDVERAVSVRAGYRVAPKVTRVYQETLQRVLEPWPDMQKRLWLRHQDGG